MNQKIKKIIKYFLVLVLAGVSVSALAQWTPPSTTPPGGNVFLPINVGSDLQEKTGALVAGALQTNTGIFVGSSTGTSVSQHFRMTKGDISPNAGFFRFGDGSGWKLHFGSLTTGGNINSGTTGTVLTIQDNGRVGIGNTSPSATLDVNGTIRISGGNPSAGRVLTSDAQGFASWVTPIGGTSTSTSPWTVSGNNIFNSNTGNVGVGTGTTVPSHRLQVNGNIALQNSGIIGSGNAYGTPGNANSATLQLYASNGDTNLSNVGYNIKLQTANTTRVFVGNNGDVGIGTTTPATALDVNGAVKLGNSNVCTTTTVGSIKYNPTAGRLEFCAPGDTEISGSLPSWRPVNTDSYTPTGSSPWNLNSNNVSLANNNYNVGIGTSTPTSKLSVLGNASFSGNVISAGPSAGFRFNSRLSGGSDFQWYSSGTTARLFSHSNGNDILTVGNTGNTLINGTFNVGGYVGIGTTNTSVPLEVKSATSGDTNGVILRLGGTQSGQNTTYDFSRTNGDLVIQGNQSSYPNNIIFSPNSGGVGIGTNPGLPLGAELSVKGGIKMDNFGLTRPSCNDTTRGVVWYLQNSPIAGNDSITICMLTGGNYIWRFINTSN